MNKVGQNGQNNQFDQKNSWIRKIKYVEAKLSIAEYC